MVRFIVLAALAAGAGAIAVALTSDHRDAQVAWAVFGPAVGWSFVFTGPLRLAPAAGEPHRRADGGARLRLVPDHAGAVGRAAALHGRRSSSAALWGGVLLHIGVSFPTGRLTALAGPRARARRLPGDHFGLVPALFFAGPSELGCDACPENLLLIDRDPASRASARRSAWCSTRSLLVAVLARTTVKLRPRRRRSGSS